MSLSQFKCHKSISTKVISEKFTNSFIFLPAFYLIMCLMKASKNFENIAILKTQELVSFLGYKTHFGKLALKGCIFRHKERRLWSILCGSFWSNYNFYILSTSKWPSESQFCERYLHNCPKNDQKCFWHGHFWNLNFQIFPSKIEKHTCQNKL